MYKLKNIIIVTLLICAFELWSCVTVSHGKHAGRLGWLFLEPDIQTGSEKQEREFASVCTVHCWALKDIYSVSACERSSELIPSGLLINTLCFMEYLINAHALMLLPSPCLSWIHMGRWSYEAPWASGSCLSSAADDGLKMDRHHTWSRSTRSGDVAAATPPADYCFHWSVGARPSALALQFLVHLSIKKLTEEHPSIRLNVPLSDAPNRLIELRPGFCQRWFFNPVTFVFCFAEYPQQLIDIWIKPIQEDGWWVNNIESYMLANQIMHGERSTTVNGSSCRNGIKDGTG